MKNINEVVIEEQVKAEDDVVFFDMKPVEENDNGGVPAGLIAGLVAVAGGVAAFVWYKTKPWRMAQAKKLLEKNGCVVTTPESPVEDNENVVEVDELD